MERMLAVQERNGEAQDARVARAIAEGPDYTWTKNPQGWTCCTAKGTAYLVTERGECSCEDYKHACCGRELRCKHAVALNHYLLTLETAPAAPAPAEKPKGLPLMSDAECARFDRLFA